jgi:hypothetical protein
MNMPLRDVQLSDEAPAILSDKLSEKCRECIAAYERTEELETALKGLLGFLSYLNKNPAFPERLRERMLLDHRVIDAQEMLRP